MNDKAVLEPIRKPSVEWAKPVSKPGFRIGSNAQMGLNGVVVQVFDDGRGIDSQSVNVIVTGVRGDFNNDGEVRSKDAILTLRIAARLTEPIDYQKRAADMNEDGKIRSNDAILILRKAAGS